MTPTGGEFDRGSPNVARHGDAGHRAGPHDAIVIGSGPNGLAAAVTLASAGKSVHLIEAADRIGGGLASAESTLPGYVHDVCAAVMAMAPVSPVLQELQRSDDRVELVEPAAAFAHPFDDGTAAIVYRSMDRTVDTLGRDAAAYRRLMTPLLRNAPSIFHDTLRPLGIPRHPFAMAAFGLPAVQSARRVASHTFEGSGARGMFAGAAAHAVLPLERAGTAAFGLMMCLSAHVGGWPIVRGGSQRLADALAARFRALGGDITTGTRVTSLDDLPPARAVLADIGPRQLLQLAGTRLSPMYRRRLARFRYGPGVYKIDWALSEPIPWKALDVREAATVHIGGSFDDIAAAEDQVWRGEHARQPFVLLVQPSIFDTSRAPAGRHTAWGYCHVPHGSTQDMAAEIEAQVERFAPGFRDVVIGRSTATTSDLEARNANLVGGDITGGANVLHQIIGRPIIALEPYATSERGLYLCSASTPPGAGVHGMCGYNAARSALRSVLR